MGCTAASRTPLILSATLLLSLGGCAERLPTEAAYGPMLHREADSGKGARLLACPAKESTEGSGVVGPQGGSVSVDGHRIRIEPGTLSEPTRITLTAPSGPHVRLELSAGGAGHYSFDRPVQITISYARCRWPVETVGLPSAWFVDGTGALIERMEGTNDAGVRSVTFETDHLSTYAVAY